MPVIAGTGTIDTEACIAMGLRAKELGADGTLVVTPRASGRQRGASTSLSKCSGRRHSRGRIALSSTLREMIARPDVSRTEWKTTERAGGPKLAHRLTRIVPPRYYVKPPQEALVGHFTRIADAVDLPMILYNVPGRTGVDLLPETVATLSTHQGRKRVIQRLFNVGVLEAMSESKASTL